MGADAKFSRLDDPEAGEGLIVDFGARGGILVPATRLCIKRCYQLGYANVPDEGVVGFLKRSVVLR